VSKLRIISTGVAEGVLIIVLLAFLPRVLEPYLAAQGFQAPGLIDELSGGSALFIVASLAATTALRVILSETRYAGAFRIFQSVLTGVYFYLLLQGGDFSVQVVYHGYPLSAKLNLTYALLLLEVSSGFNAACGLTQLLEKQRFKPVLHPQPSTKASDTGVGRCAASFAVPQPIRLVARLRKFGKRLGSVHEFPDRRES